MDGLVTSEPICQKTIVWIVQDLLILLCHSSTISLIIIQERRQARQHISGTNYKRRSVIIPLNCHYNQNGWLKYDHRVMYKKYTTPCPHMGCGVVERHLEMAQPTKTKRSLYLGATSIIYNSSVMKMLIFFSSMTLEL